jgi:DNA-binding GntR family transcriptional regulator
VQGRNGSEWLATDQYLRIRADILNGVFPVGQRLLETSLATRYGVSRTPVREALSALQHEGLIERTESGFRVRTGTAEDVIEIYEARIALESAAAAAAARRRTDLDLTRLQVLHEAAGETRELRAGHEANSTWHRALWAAAHNHTISIALERWSAQLRIYDQGPPGPADDLLTTHDEHAVILEAIRERDETTAAATMEAHLVRSRSLRLSGLA